MKREILKYDRRVSGCCPRHDVYPDTKYKNIRSARARARGIMVEHQNVRAIIKQELLVELIDLTEYDDTFGATKWHLKNGGKHL
jgi:hypothetical protein